MIGFKFREMERRRKDLGLSCEQLARKVGVAKMTAYNWGRGVSSPPRHRLAKIAKVLGCGISDLATLPVLQKSDPSVNGNFSPFKHDEMQRRRVESGLTQKAVADFMGVGIATVYAWEGGRVIPRSHRIAKLAKIFHCNISDLYAIDSVLPDGAFNFNGSEMMRRRLNLGLSRKDIAARLKVSISCVYYWETRRSVPEDYLLSQLVRILKCRVADLSSSATNKNPDVTNSAMDQIMNSLNSNLKNLSAKKRTSIISMVADLMNHSAVPAR